MQFEELIKATKDNISTLNSKYKISMPKDCWITKAIQLTEDLVDARNKKIPGEQYFKKRAYLYDESLTSISELTNLNGILEQISRINENNLQIFIGKLKKIFNAPLLLRDEDINSNEGKNTMFELRLFTKLLGVGYETELSNDHPDISVHIDGNDYFIECKRIFKKETLIKNARDAVIQLENFSLKKLGYGIVALSVTRYFHAGDKRLKDTESQEAAKVRINHEMDMLIKENGKKLFNLFPLKIPAIFLEFADRAVADKAYFMNLIDVIETANGRTSLFHKVKKDFSKLSTQNMI